MKTSFAKNYTLSIAFQLSCTTGVAERYVENIRLKGELNESRSDLANRERRLEVLQSQVDGIDGATTQTRIKVNFFNFNIALRLFNEWALEKLGFVNLKWLF